MRVSYRYFSVPIPWFEAKLICQDDDSELAMPKNEAEHNAIFNIILQNPPPTGNETSPSYDYIALNSHDMFNINEFVTQGIFLNFKLIKNISSSIIYYYKFKTLIFSII